MKKDTTEGHSPLTHLTQRELALEFAKELRRARMKNGYSQRALADELGYHRTYISKIESGAEPPTRAVAERADEILQQKGKLVQIWRAYRAADPRKGRQNEIEELESEVRFDRHAHRTELVVLHEDCRLTYEGGKYWTHVRRELYNGSDAPITRYRIRVAVDRHPNASELSNAFYRQRPLLTEELSLQASCEGEEMSWEVAHDRDAFKEIWLLFEGKGGKFPLYPGHTTSIEYKYSVGAEQWGKWWQRAIRVPTERISAEIVLPSAMEPTLWGLQTTLFAERLPMQPGIDRHEVDGVVRYRWSTERPPLHARFRFEWRFRVEADEEPFQLPPGERMRHLGIVQRGDRILTKPCVPFDLPAEADIARATGELLVTYLDPLAMLHDFGKGMGLAAPQIGVARSAAVVRLPKQQPLVLYNPTIVRFSPNQDERMEGCLSFFDVRGRVRRALKIQVQHTLLTGERRVVTFENAAARHWQHEIDHLQGFLYMDRMDDPAAELIPLEEYDGLGEQWHYQ